MADENKSNAEFTDFIDLAKNTESDDVADPKEKRKHLIEEEFIPLVIEPVSEELEQEGFKVKINRNGEVIESIDVIHKSGDKTRLVFDYPDES